MRAEIEQWLAQLQLWLEMAVSRLASPAILYQLAVIALLLLPSVLLARKYRPLLATRAGLDARKGVMASIAGSLLRNLRWVLFALLCGAALAVTAWLNWPAAARGLLFSSLRLALAWLLISVLVQGIPSPTLRALLAVLGWLFVATLILGVTDDLAAALDAMGFALGGTRISLLLLLQMTLVLIVTLWMALGIGNFLDRRIQRNDELAPGLRVLVGKVVKISLVVIAVILTISGIGIDLTIFSVLSGAIGVGIGFGLQKVVSNFISGLIILADRSIKPGDTITLGDTFGWIRELRARFVSVITRDGREYLIPNEDFITKQVINWSFSNDLVRLDVHFGVSYNADPHRVTELAITAVAAVPRVVETMPPVCWLTGFGESSLDFVVRFWIRDPQAGMTNIRGQVLMTLWDIFKANDISIPYPHREVIIRREPAGTGAAAADPGNA